MLALNSHAAHCGPRVKRTDMEHWLGKLDVPKVARTIFRHLITCRAHCAAINTSQLRVVQTLLAWPVARLVHGLRIFNMTDRHVLDLLGGEETELNLLDLLERRGGEGERVVPTDGCLHLGWCEAFASRNYSLVCVACG